MPETIWSNSGNKPGLTTGSTNDTTQYKTVFDLIDPEVAKMFAYNDPLGEIGSDLVSRRLSMNDGSDLDGNVLGGFRPGALSAITAPVGGGTGGAGGPGNHSPNQGQRLGLGTASINGGIASRHPPQDSFLQKFSHVAEATRDIELSNNFGKLNLDGSGNSRRTSFNGSSSATATSNTTNSNTPIASNSNHSNNSSHPSKHLSEVGYGSPTGSLNESLNMPTNNRNSRHQSISEKIDHYNSTSPIQGSASLSISSDLNSATKDDLNKQGNNIWNPATAASFTPVTYNGLPANDGTTINAAPPPAHPGTIENMYGANGNGTGMGVHPPPPHFNPYGRNNPTANPISPPPFMLVSPPLQFMDPRMYSMNYVQQPPPPPPSNDNNTEAGSGEGPDGSDEKSNDSKPKDSKSKDSIENNNSNPRKNFPHTPGIGMSHLFNSPGYMFQSFNPYNMYQQSPPFMNVAVQEEPVNESDAATPELKSLTQSVETSNSNTPTQPPNGNSRKKGSSKASNGGKGAPHIYRSPLLEEVRSNFKGKEYYLKDIYGHAIEFTKDQHGSRFIQQKLPDGSDEEKEVIFNEIRDISYELMTDVFGNYVIQKYFEFGSTTQKNVLLEYMLGHIYELSLQMYGCRVVQRALEAIELEGQIKIITELKNSVLVCAKDQNGNHVIQKSIERIPFENVRFILDSLENQIYHLSTHPYGCRVIQRLLEYSSEDDQKKILGELNRFIFYLIQDQYGNYVMQHILERGSKPDKEAILKIVLGSVVNFSKHKFASNVIEKCIKFGTFDQRKQILHEVLLGNEDLEVESVSDDSPLALMMKDQYANYVIQKLVEGFDTKSEEKRLLVLKLRQYLKQISSKNTYGKHLASVEKMIIVAETALIEAENS